MVSGPSSKLSLDCSPLTYRRASLRAKPRCNKRQRFTLSLVEPGYVA